MLFNTNYSQFCPILWSQSSQQSPCSLNRLLQVHLHSCTTPWCQRWNVNRDGRSPARGSPWPFEVATPFLRLLSICGYPWGRQSTDSLGSQEHARHWQRTIYNSTLSSQQKLIKLLVDLEFSSVKHYLTLAHTNIHMLLLSPHSVLAPHSITQTSQCALQMWRAPRTTLCRRLITIIKKNEHIRGTLQSH